MKPVESFEDEFPDAEVLPIETALEDVEVRERLRSADVVFGLDRSVPGHRTIMAGLSAIERVAKTGRAATLDLVFFSYDSRTDSLEFFAAACKTLRGRCDYQASGELSRERRMFIDSWNAS